MRSAALPIILGQRWFGDNGRMDVAGSPGASWLVRAKIAADEFFFATEFLAGAPFGFLDARRIAAEVERAVDLYRRHGWLGQPESFHQTPPPLESFDRTDGRIRGLTYQHLRFESGYTPHEDEPGRDRWLSYTPNRTAHAWLFRHPGPQRPWVVCVPGYRMGQLPIDVAGFRIARLHRQLGLNVAVPVLPFHGPRSSGRRSGDGYLAGDFVDTVHAQAQTIWDARRLIAWLRQEGAPAIGLYGLSLGAFTTALLASLEDRLDCVIVGMPVVDFVRLVKWNMPGLMFQATERLGFPWDEVSILLRVISPLAMRLRADRTRCFLFGGAVDTLAPPAHTRELWRHWGEPRLVMYDGGHVSFLIESDVRDLVVEALSRTGLLPARPH